MKKALKKNAARELFHFVGGRCIAGAPDRTKGDISGLWGQVDAVTGNVDECGLTDEERAKGMDITTLTEA